MYKAPEIIEKIHKEQKIKYKDISEKLGVSRQTLYKWKSGKMYPTMKKYLEIVALESCDFKGVKK